MVEIDLVLKNLADKTGKRKGDLKRSYNSIKKKKQEEGIEDLVPEATFERIILLGVANKIGVEPETLDKVITSFEDGEETDEDVVDELEDLEEDDFEEDEIEVVFEEDNDDDDEEDGFETFDSIDEMAGDFKVENSWEDIFSSTPEPSEGKAFERLESLLIMPGVEYIIKIADPTEVPYKHEGIGSDGKPYVSRAFDVTLVDLSPVRKFREKYESGDNRGKKCFVKNKKYKFWLSKVAFEWFAEFWRSLDRKSPDGRAWTYEKVKKAKVTKHYFGEV